MLLGPRFENHCSKEYQMTSKKLCSLMIKSNLMLVMDSQVTELPAVSVLSVLGLFDIDCSHFSILKYRDKLFNRLEPLA